MVALKTERSVFLWHLSPHTMPKEAPVSTTLSEILNILEDAFKSKKAFAHIDSDGNLVALGTASQAKNCIYIADYTNDIDSGTITLLINRGDPDVAHPSFINPLQSTVKNVPPGTDEVQGWSAHLVISSSKDAKGRYRACFERMPNVSSSLVQKYLDALIDRATEGDTKYVYDKPIKKGKKTIVQERVYKLRLGINKVPSESLERDIKNGTLAGINLIRTQPKYAGPGNPSIVKTVKEQVSIRMKDVDENEVIDFARKVIDWGRGNQYDEIQFKIEDLPGNQTSSPRFNLEKADAIDTLYTRSKRLTDFANLLETCYPRVNKDIASRMCAELTNEANW